MLDHYIPSLNSTRTNEKDNDTNAAMGINIEFLKSFNGRTTQETTKEMPSKTKYKVNACCQTFTRACEESEVSNISVRYKWKCIKRSSKLKNLSLIL